MLKPRQMIPALAARGMDGRTVRASDYKQKKSVVVVFLRAEEAASAEYVQRLAGHGEDFAENEAQVIVVFDARAADEVAVGLPEQMLLAADVSGKSQRAWLGEEAFGPGGLARVGVFVADRFGELFSGWTGGAAAELPGMRAILSTLGQIAMACEECGPAQWPAE